MYSCYIHQEFIISHYSFCHCRNTEKFYHFLYNKNHIKVTKTFQTPFVSLQQWLSGLLSPTPSSKTKLCDLGLLLNLPEPLQLLIYKVRDVIILNILMLL